jgi:hypothetical protein
MVRHGDARVPAFVSTPEVET